MAPKRSSKRKALTNNDGGLASKKRKAPTKKKKAPTKKPKPKH